MAYLEELLPEFRKGAKIRRKDWKKEQYLYFEGKDIWNENDELIFFPGEDFLYDNWELYQEPESEPDWDYIIKNKCLCWFWDGEKDNNASMGCLGEVYSEKYNSFRSREGTRWNHCIPVCKDEVTFYEDRKDE